MFPSGAPNEDIIGLIWNPPWCFCIISPVETRGRNQTQHVVEIESLQIHNKNICCSCCVSKTTPRRVSRHSTCSPSCRGKFKMWQRRKRFKTNWVFFSLINQNVRLHKTPGTPPSPPPNTSSTHTKATWLLQAPWFRATPSLLYRVESYEKTWKLTFRIRKYLEIYAE